MTSLVQNLLHWFSKNQRSLPWRVQYDPYQVWISEIMLQQTQMDRVIPYFLRWLGQFPTIEAVASASEDAIHKAWEGLGYYSRARNLHKCAQMIINEYDAKLPDNYEELLNLPGVGPYTAGAIMSIAFNKNYPVVDANIKRLFARIFDINKPLGSEELKKACSEKAISLLPKKQAREFNQALMELGALVCLPRSPHCENCPLTAQCESYKKNIVHLRPLPSPAKKLTPVTVVAGVICHNGLIYIQKRLPNARWANLWEFPGGHVEKGEKTKAAITREILEETEFQVDKIKKLCTIKNTFTRYSITLHAYSCNLVNGCDKPVLHAAQEYCWLPLEDLDKFAFSAGHRRLLNQLLEKKVLFPCKTKVNTA